VSIGGLLARAGISVLSLPPSESARIYFLKTAFAALIFTLKLRFFQLEKYLAIDNDSHI